ncbi:hypothetical protein N7492_009141 [Penicillium capsulatum]|uniref:J domain-containing protein n=1 Tax=Penicillium capsulatum TaxID=69766 RepID=A0A9W9HR24_9EURO|nr:hypothetical protein N7492_009141 [Penicillium capsulatum]KAJ6106540.1 hypothetical protein N7512_010057 [Penicillium capsulatum]
MLNKPNFFCCGGLTLLNSPVIVSPPACPRFGTAGHGVRAIYSRHNYTTTSHAPSGDYKWPNTPSFSPYDVLNLHRSAPYSKSRYYELVKIYHPDRPCQDHPLCRNLSREVRTQRYRIVVTAHEILSDPNRRAAYDHTGAGWSHHPQRYPTAAHGTAGWGSYGPTIYSNATWEDWERWNQRRQGPQRHVVDQHTFTRLVILLVLFGGALQASWIGQLNTGFETRLREVSEDSMRFLTGRRQNTVNQMASNDARVQSFLIRRDPTGSGLKEDEQPVYQRELHPRHRAANENEDRVQDPSDAGTAHSHTAEEMDDMIP